MINSLFSEDFSALKSFICQQWPLTMSSQGRLSEAPGLIVILQQKSINNAYNILFVNAVQV